MIFRWCLVVVLAAGALLMWPAGGAGGSPLNRVPGTAGRLPASVRQFATRPAPADRRAARGTAGHSRREGRPGRWAVRGALPAAVLATAVAGPVCGAAAAIGTATALLLWHRAVLARRHRHDLTDLAAGLRLLARELRAGAAPRRRARRRPRRPPGWPRGCSSP